MLTPCYSWPMNIVEKSYYPSCAVARRLPSSNLETISVSVQPWECEASSCALFVYVYWSMKTSHAGQNGLVQCDMIKSASRADTATAERLTNHMPVRPRNTKKAACHVILPFLCDAGGISNIRAMLKTYIDPMGNCVTGGCW